MKKGVAAWLKSRGWKPFEFQEATWKAYLSGQSGLVHAPTGMGKTYAVWMGPILEYLAESHSAPPKSEPLRVLWITPLRALANDTAATLRAPIEAMNLPWTVELRTGDTSSAVRARQRLQFPTALVTTPESLSLLLSFPDTRAKLQELRCVVVDEWHELLGSKRGVQTELCLARLRAWLPQVRTWGLSATLGNLEQAREVLLGNTPGQLIRGVHHKEVELQTLVPADVGHFPWAGHLGLKLLPEVIAELEKAKTTLLFTNTRSQTEIWFRALSAARPDWAGQIDLHHGSVERQKREEVEGRLRAGTIKCVICTSSLDLGVDFSPVEQVIQVGAPKGIARMVQRAGRSGHQPGLVSRLLCVPAHAFELVEFAAVREALPHSDREAREPLRRPLDVLAQHLVTLALGEPFVPEELLAEVRTSYAYGSLTDQEWQWVLDFVARGGAALQAYPQFARLTLQEGKYTVLDPFIAKLHRLSVGTITSDTSMSVRFVRGASLGTIEESFIARLKPGDRFAFAGQALELVRVRDMVAYVRKAPKTPGLVPSWMGGRLPLSSQLARVVRQKLGQARRGIFEGPEMEAARPVLEQQSRWSHLPDPNELLIEQVRTREGWQQFIYPFAGRLVHEGVGALLAWRLAREAPRSVSVTANDYGFALLSPTPLELDEGALRRLFARDRLVEDLLACLNASELARRQFREIARVAGLVFQGFPGSNKSMRHLQASSGLFFEVFTKYDPDNLLLTQARREVLEQQLEVNRLGVTLEALESMKLVIVRPERLTPLSFPLWAEFIQSQVTTENWGDRVRRMAEQLEAAASLE